MSCLDRTLAAGAFRLSATLSSGSTVRGKPDIVRQFCIQSIRLDASLCKFCQRIVNADAEVTELLRDYFEKRLNERNRSLFRLPAVVDAESRLVPRVLVRRITLTVTCGVDDTFGHYS